jgi:hypothetical protein
VRPGGETTAKGGGPLTKVAIRQLGRLDQRVMIRGEAIENPRSELPACRLAAMRMDCRGVARAARARRIFPPRAARAPTASGLVNLCPAVITRQVCPRSARRALSCAR